MKKFIYFFFIAIALNVSAQEKPIFYDSNDNVVTEINCETPVNGLKIVYPIPEDAFKYDEVYFFLKIISGEGDFDTYMFVKSMLKKEFTIKFEGKESHTLWVADPNNKGLGELTYQKVNNVSDQYLCGNSKNTEITIVASIIGYVQTSSEQLWDDYNESWYTQYYYDEGTYLTSSDVLVAKQTEANIKSYKKKKLMRGFGL